MLSMTPSSINGSIERLIRYNTGTATQHQGSEDIILRGYDHSPQGRAANESSVRYHHQRGGQDNVDQSSVT